MAQPYDMALRERAVAAYERGDGTYAELATLVMLDPRTLERWVARLRATGSVAPRSKGGGWRSPIDLDALRAVVRAQPDGTALELCRVFNRCVRRAQRTTETSVRRAMHRQGYVLKKTGAAERNRPPGRSRETRGDPEMGAPHRSAALGIHR